MLRCCCHTNFLQYMQCYLRIFISFKQRIESVSAVDTDRCQEGHSARKKSRTCNSLTFFLWRSVPVDFAHGPYHSAVLPCCLWLLAPAQEVVRAKHCWGQEQGQRPSRRKPRNRQGLGKDDDPARLMAHSAMTGIKIVQNCSRRWSYFFSVCK